MGAMSWSKLRKPAEGATLVESGFGVALSLNTRPSILASGSQMSVPANSPIDKATQSFEQILRHLFRTGK
jgi:hypothetical protein